MPDFRESEHPRDNGAEYDVMDSMPDGWVRIDKDAPEGYAFASNNKSRFSGQRKIALVKL